MNNKKTKNNATAHNSSVANCYTPKYWYKLYVQACPICGKEDIWKERQYTPKPDSPEEKISYKEIYDYCNSL